MVELLMNALLVATFCNIFRLWSIK